MVVSNQTPKLNRVKFCLAHTFRQTLTMWRAATMVNTPDNMFDTHVVVGHVLLGNVVISKNIPTHTQDHGDA